MQLTSLPHLSSSQASPIPTPLELHHELPLSPRQFERVLQAREQVKSVLNGDSARLLVIAGPCSVHDPVAALEYAERLRRLADRVSDEVLLVMRVYFEKPRTSLGWKGFINDPHLDGSCNIGTGLRLARQLLVEITGLGLPIATELLDPLILPYLEDCLSWAAIGARTSESQIHRELASQAPIPVGFKNATDGSIEGAVAGIVAASHPHRFLGLDQAGKVALIRARGNPDGHLVLRGGKHGPNYSKEHVSAATCALSQAQLRPRLIIDCSHGNSRKDFSRQVGVFEELTGRLSLGERAIAGVMLESHLLPGNQPLLSAKDLTFGQSITDACIDFATTEKMLLRWALQRVRAL